MEINELRIDQVPFLRIFLCFASGILLAYQLQWSDAFINGLFLFVSLLFLRTSLLWLRKRRGGIHFLLYLLLFFLGVLSISTKMPRYKPDLQNSLVYHAKLLDDPIRKGQVLRCRIEILAQEQSSKSPEMNLLTIVTIWDKDSVIHELNKGDLVRFKSKIQELVPAFNPRQFDYSRYLNGKGIFYQTFIPTADFSVISHSNANPIFSWIEGLQKALQSKFKKYITNLSSFQIASAITFGYRSDISAEVMEIFSNTGTIHVLSVSGFHVSMMFLFLTWILKPIDRLPYGRSARFTFILCFIWFYALICGFVPAVLRATLMFSLFLIGYWRSRVVFSLNAVFSSAFLLLIYDPFMIFDIGFQLSYLAVLGILIFVPILQEIYSSKSKLINKFLSLLYVSFTAQLTTTALAIFYFNQFPTFFLLSNLVITIPSVFILILGSFLATLPWDAINIFIGEFLNQLILISYWILKWIDSIPLSSIQGLVLPLEVILLTYLCVLFFFLGYRFKQKVFLFSALIMCLLTTGLIFKSRLDQKSFVGIKIYNTRKDFTLAMIQNGSVRLLSTCDSLKHKTLKLAVLSDLKQYAELKDIEFTNIKSIHENQHIRLFPDQSVYIQNTQSKNRPECNLLVLRNNSCIPKELNARLTILDGSNSKGFIEEAIAQLNAVNRAYYLLKDNFAYVWESK